MAIRRNWPVPSLTAAWQLPQCRNRQSCAIHSQPRSPLRAKIRTNFDPQAATPRLPISLWEWPSRFRQGQGGHTAVCHAVGGACASRTSNQPATVTVSKGFGFYRGPQQGVNRGAIQIFFAAAWKVWPREIISGPFARPGTRHRNQAAFGADSRTP